MRGYWGFQIAGMRPLESPITKRLLADLEIRIVTAPLFVASKLEAFKGRRNGDYLESHDLEDMVAVVDGRESLVTEVHGERKELRAYIQNEIGGLLANGRFVDALPGYLFPDAASQARIALVLERLEALLNPSPGGA